MVTLDTRHSSDWEDFQSVVAVLAEYGEPEEDRSDHWQSVEVVVDGDSLPDIYAHFERLHVLGHAFVEYISADQDAARFGGILYLDEHDDKG